MAGSHGRMFRSVYWRFLVHNGYVQPRHTKSSKRQNTMFLQQCHELNQTNVTSCFVFSTFWWYLGCLNFTLNTLVSRVKSMSRHLQRQHSAEHCWIQQPLRDLTSSFSWKCSSFYAWKVTWFVSKALYLHLPKLGPLRSALIVFQQDMSQCLCLLFKQFWLHVTWSVCNNIFRALKFVSDDIMCFHHRLLLLQTTAQVTAILTPFVWKQLELISLGGNFRVSVKSSDFQSLKSHLCGESTISKEFDRP